jgi:hypothetical protein
MPSHPAARPGDRSRKPQPTPEQAAGLVVRAKTEKRVALAPEFGISRVTLYQDLRALL